MVGSQILVECLQIDHNRWLVRRSRDEDAKEALRSLTSSKHADTSFRIDDTVAMMVTTNELEKAIESGVGYIDCFKGVDLRRTEIVCITWAIQNLCGSAFMGYSTYFYEQAGLPVIDAFNMSMAQYALGFIGTIISWFLMHHFGRRTLYVSGLCILTFLLLLIGFASLSSTNAASWSIGSLLLLFTLLYNLTIGPLTYALISELPSTRLKSKTLSLARILYNIIAIANNVIMPYMLNPTAWNWKAHTSFFWAGSCLLCTTWAYFRLPEPRHRTYAELDVLFERRVPARKFAGWDVGLWGSGDDRGKKEGERGDREEQGEEDRDDKKGKEEGNRIEGGVGSGDAKRVEVVGNGMDIVR
ncbi:hypothetical protein ACMFMG_006502 [Clarireedia jacksonii]